MKTHFEQIAIQIEDVVDRYNNSLKLVAPLVKVYADKNLKDWQHFSGWNFTNNGKTIQINYSYEEYWSNTETYTEFDSITVSLIDILKVMDEYMTIKNKE